jgi:hypothetical protein
MRLSVKQGHFPAIRLIICSEEEESLIGASLFVEYLPAVRRVRENP